MAKGEQGKARNGSRKNRRDDDVMRDDFEARMEGPVKKSWTLHDLVPLEPGSDNQRAAIAAYCQGDHLAMLGSAGAGKTTLACYLAAGSLVRNEVEKIILVRSAVEQREQGFVPGTQEEKDAKFEEPYVSAFGHIFGHPTTYQWMKRRGLIEFRTTGNLRSLNFDNAVVVGDEVQNLNFEELHTFITRLGPRSRLIMCGDQAQCDLKRFEIKGLPIFEELAGDLPNLTVVKFSRHDCLRHGFVRAWLGAVEDWHKRREETRPVADITTKVAG
uniref:PhoH-like protein n=1 Tax=Pseudomonas phage PA_L9 TaxID=3232177 RepID=A0AAU8L109_9CAUD